MSSSATSVVNSRKIPGDHYKVHATLTLPSSYPTGGFDFSAISLFNLSNYVAYCKASSSTSAGKPVFVDNANRKIKVFSAIGTEVSASTDLSAETLDVEAYGW